MPARRFLALWATVHEPRFVTVTYMLLYVAAVVSGLAISLEPASAILARAPEWVALTIAAMLAGGGSVGVPAAWRGDRWLERPVVITVGAALGLLLLNVTMLYPHVWPFTALLAAVVAASLVPRWLTVTSLTYAPGKGRPLSPADEARLAQIEG